MNPRHKASAAAIDLIKRFEGYRQTAAQLADGRWTVGYGHTKTAREGSRVSEADAEALLIYDLIEVQAVVNASVYTPLTQNQYDALVAFAFNIGADNFRHSSTLRRVNEGNLIQAACAIEMWRKADLDGERIVVDALVRRRAAEKALFLTPVGGWTPSPSPIVRPRVDYDVGLSLPRSSAEVAVVMTGGRGEAHKAPPSAESMAARLQAIAAEPAAFAEAEAGIDLTPPPASPEEGRAVEHVEVPAARPVELSPLAAAEPVDVASADGPAPDISSHHAAAAPRRVVRREAPVGAASFRFVTDPRTGNMILLLVALAGLALFAGSVFWGVNAEESEGQLSPLVVGSILGVVGIACVASAVYLLLVRLGGRDD